MGGKGHGGTFNSQPNFKGVIFPIPNYPPIDIDIDTDNRYTDQHEHSTTNQKDRTSHIIASQVSR